jgi:hypothetical protein
LKELELFDSNGRRSGEIFELSPNNRPIAKTATTAYRESRLKATEIAGMASLGDATHLPGELIGSL